MSRFNQIMTRLMHGHCIRSSVDQHNKQVRLHAATVVALQDEIANLNSDILRLNKEILFTQEGYEREIANLHKQISMMEEEVRHTHKKGKNR